MDYVQVAPSQFEIGFGLFKAVASEGAGQSSTRARSGMVEAVRLRIEDAGATDTASDEPSQGAAAL